MSIKMLAINSNTAAPESIYIFSKLGAEPIGRIGTGVLELIASILILMPKTTFYGAVLGFGLMSGAIFSHLFVLGISVQNDGGKLFMLAMISFLICIYLIIKTIPLNNSLLKRFYASSN